MREREREREREKKEGEILAISHDMPTVKWGDSTGLGSPSPTCSQLNNHGTLPKEEALTTYIFPRTSDESAYEPR